MRLSKSAFCLLIFFILYGCFKKESTDKRHISGLQYAFLKETNLVNPLIRGIWRSIGNGYYLEAKEDSILLYSYTQNFCYKEKNDYLESLLNSQSRFLLRGDTAGVYLADFGKATKRLQSKKDFIRVSELPNNCVSFSEMLNFDASKLYELYLETHKENYAFADERKLDWKLIHEQYANRMNSTLNEDSLFQIMGEIATLTKDQHTKVISENGKTLQYRVTPSAEVVKEVFNSQSEIDDLNDYFNLFFETNFKNISDSLLRGNGRKVANEQIEWGSLNDDVGYIAIHSFAGLLSKEFTREQQIDSLNYQMQQIINTFQNKEAIIVDISFNFGGYDAVALTIASYFTDIPILSHISQVYNNGEFYDEDKVIIYPSDSISFTKPVYVLMTDISRSAAESFAMMMNVLPNTKLIGNNTLGTLSGMLGKSIGNFYTTYSNQRLVTDRSHFYEVQGVKPDIEMTVFPTYDVFNGHKRAVDNIVDIIQQSKFPHR